MDRIFAEIDGDGVILFPRGWFTPDKQKAKTTYKWVEQSVMLILAKNKRKGVTSKHQVSSQRRYLVCNVVSP